MKGIGIIDRVNKKVNLTKWKGKGILDIDYKSHPTAVVHKKKDNLFVVDIILNSKPNTNVWKFKLKSKGLHFTFQPELSQEDKDNGCIRPDNIIGSYAVYHISKKNNEYGLGKFCHIYRPEAFDVNGKHVWCDMRVNKRIDPSLMTITVPQEFLDHATYPVTVDPDFGNSNEGKSWIAVCTGTPINISSRIGSAFEMPSGGPWAANYIKAYLFGNGAATDCKAFINQRDSGGAGTHAQVATDENLACITTAHWEQFTLSSEVLTSGVNYILNVCGDNADQGGFIKSYYMAFDNNGSVDSYSKSGTYTSPDSPLVADADVTTKDYSIWCDYSAPVASGVGMGAKPPIMEFLLAGILD